MALKIKQPNEKTFHMAIDAKDAIALWTGHLTEQAAWDKINTLSLPNDWYVRELDGLYYVVPFGTMVVKL